jgi:pimeloyl-ACP methyl ester carboxylesterase
MSPPPRPTLILLPALPCGADFYASQVDALFDLVDPKIMVLEEASLAASAAALLAAAPANFFLAGTAYGGCLAIEIAVTAPERIAGLWLMNCNPGRIPILRVQGRSVPARVAVNSRQYWMNGRRSSWRKRRRWRGLDFWRWRAPPARTDLLSSTTRRPAAPTIGAAWKE